MPTPNYSIGFMDTIETFISPFYIISNNLIIYIIINNIEYYIKNVKHKDYLKTVYKKIITIIISIITSIIAVIIFDKDLEAIVTSALLSIVFYDYIVSYLIKDPIKKTPLGFVSLEYIQNVTLNETDERFIWKYQNDIANILNMGK